MAPRLGLTYDLTGDARNVIKGSYAIYFDQRSAGQLSKALNPTGSARIDLGWSDLNGDSVVQVNEINQSLIRSVTGFDPANPAGLVSANTVDPNVTAPRTNEIVVGFGKEMAGDVGFNASYVWRRYDHFIWNDTIGISSSDYSAVPFTPPSSACPSGARCDAVTYYVPNATLPSAYTVTNRPDFRRVYNGLELVVRKRSSRGWMLNASYSYNTTLEHYDSAAAYEDPTNIDRLNGFQHSPSAGIGGGGGSNLAGIPVNAKWIAKLNGTYRLPHARSTSRRQRTCARGIRSRKPSTSPRDRIAHRRLPCCSDPARRAALPEFCDDGLQGRTSVHGAGMKMLPSFDMFNVFNSSTVMGPAHESERGEREQRLRDPGAADRARRPHGDLLVECIH